MSGSENRKPIPRSVLIFGAAAHIGRPLAHFFSKEAAEIQLRLVSSHPERREELKREFPHAEVVHADYFDRASLDSAVRGMEGIFVITPGGMPEEPAMNNLVDSLRRSGSVVQILRCLGMQPEANFRRIPETIRKLPALGIPIQHPLAKRILDESDLPVTYLNFGGAFMDNLLWMKGPLQRERKLIWHDRLIPFIDPHDIAEVAGRLFLSDNHRHIGQFHTLNNGHDLMRYSDVADLMTDTLGEKITHDGSREAFFSAYEHMGDKRARIWNLFEYERENEVVWARNDFVARTLCRQPVTLVEWLQEHRHQLLGSPTRQSAWPHSR